MCVSMTAEKARCKNEKSTRVAFVSTAAARQPVLYTAEPTTQELESPPRLQLMHTVRVSSACIHALAPWLLCSERQMR